LPVDPNVLGSLKPGERGTVVKINPGLVVNIHQILSNELLFIK